MAVSFQSAMRKLSVLSSRVSTVATANAGLFVILLAVVVAGVVLFYLVILPPSTAVYP